MTSYRFQLLIFVLGVVFPYSAFGQPRLPAGLTSDSSVREILNGIGGLVFAARPGLEAELPEPDPAWTTDVDRYSETAEFSPGFKVNTVEGCRVELLNQTAELIGFKSKYPDPTRGSFASYRRAANLAKVPTSIVIRLDELSARRGKAPFEYKNKGNPKISWKSVYRLKRAGGFKLVPFPLPSKEDVAMAVKNPILRATILGSGIESRDESLDGNTLSFVFSDKITAKEFDAAFRLAISQCQMQ